MLYCTALIVMVGVLLASVGSALANGPCGVNYDGDHACGINAPTTISGNLVEENESDYYVFWAPAGTQIDPTLTYSGDNGPTNNAEGSNAHMVLYDSSGSGLGLAESGDSCDCYGIEQSASLPYTLTDAGTYYLVVNGNADEPNAVSPTPTPYTLSVVTNSGSMQWPPPPPAHKLVLSIAHFPNRRRHQTLFAVTYRNADGRRVSDKGMHGSVQLLVDHRWKQVMAGPAGTRFIMHWSRPARGHKKFIREVITGGGYQTAIVTTNVIAV
jgi:hypothetical protein